MKRSAEIRAIDSEPLGEDMIEKLEEILELARRGKLSSIGFAVVYRDGCTGTCWSEVHNVGLQIAAAARLSHRLLRIGDED